MPVLPRLVALAIALIVVAAACTGDDESSEEAIAVYCERAGALRGVGAVFDPTTVDPLDPDALRTAFEQVRDEIEGALEVAPEEIRDDLETATTSARELFDQLETIGYDFTRVEDPSQFTQIGTDPETVDATRRVEAFEATNCDFGAPGATSTPEAAGTDGDTAATATPTPISQTDLAAELREEILASFSESEIADALEFVELATVEDLAVAIAAGEVDVGELDEYFQRREDGIPLVYGDDIDLDLLWDGCDAGDFATCDDLYEAAPLRSSYERFAATCGREVDDPIGGRCEDELGG